MSNYDLIFVWTAVFAVLGHFVQMQRTEIVDGKKVQRIHPFWGMVLPLPLVLWTAVRGNVADSGAYRRMFEEIPTDIYEMDNYVRYIGKDEGFYFLTGLIKKWFTKDVRIYFLLIGGLQAYLLFRLYRKYSEKYVISFFLFIASTDFVSWMFNGMRQFTAVTITLLAFEFLLEEKHLKAVLVVLLASLFHQSALLVIPFLFIVKGRAWNRNMVFFLLLALLAVIYTDRFTGILDNMLQDTQYKNAVSDWMEWGDDGTNVLRVFVYAVPSLLALVGLRYIREENDPVINICTNMSVISVGFYIVSMFTSGIFIGRLPIYFSLYGYILLPWEIDHIFEAGSARLLYGIMIGAYMIFYLVQIRLVWGFA